MREYDLIADWYATDRGRTIGVAEALAVAATLPARSRILDVGCGNGVPITEALVNAGHRVVGLDSSSGMLALFRLNLPNTPVVRADARQCPFAAGEFDAAISWGMMFHLTRLDQPAVRLITLIGPPGVGKTRLALTIAADAESVFPDGACFVALAALPGPLRLQGVLWIGGDFAFCLAHRSPFPVSSRAVICETVRSMSFTN